MATDPFRIKRITTKLEQAWGSHADMTFGQLIEEVENLAWDHYYRANPTRHFSMRLMHLADLPFEQGLNDWLAGKRSDVSKQIP